MVYLSQPTENGTLYALAELDDLWQTCQDCGLFLYVDGARLGYGLMSPACDMTLPDLARRCDAFYLGGTKQGLLFGEALVLAHPALQRDFRTISSSTGGCWPRAGCWGPVRGHAGGRPLLRPGRRLTGWP